MAKEKLHDMKQTPNSFQCRGVVTGTKSQRFYKKGDTWNALEFGMQIAENKTVYVSMNGFIRDEVYYYKKGENGAKGTTTKVKWKDRKKAPSKDHRLIGVNISTGKDENNKNINETFTEWDAIEWLNTNLKDGDSVFIKGNIRFSSYTDRNGQTRRKMEFVPNQISYTQKPVDFDAEDYKEMAEFENTLVFSNIDPEVDENEKKTGRFILSGYSIAYNSVENVSFIIPAEQEKLARNLKKRMRPGYAIKTFGRVEVINDISVVQEDDSEGWGNISPMERINSPVRREYIVYRADPNSIEEDDYSEEDILEAIRKMKASKTASENFGEKTDANNDSDDWGSDDDFGDDDSPWD